MRVVQGIGSGFISNASQLNLSECLPVVNWWLTQVYCLPEVYTGGQRRCG
jgi:hypothetical protein